MSSMYTHYVSNDGDFLIKEGQRVWSSRLASNGQDAAHPVAMEYYLCSGIGTCCRGTYLRKSEHSIKYLTKEEPDERLHYKCFRIRFDWR